MLDPPIRLLIVGVLMSEVLQFSFWMRKRGARAWRGYFTEQGHVLLANMAVNVIVALLWKHQALDTVGAFVARWFGGSQPWGQSGVPYTEEMGIYVGIGSDFFGDDIAFNLWGLGRSTLQKLGLIAKDEPAPPAGAKS